MALFGAPVAHEDDPERAVRAALAIRDRALEQEEIRVRIAATASPPQRRQDTRAYSASSRQALRLEEHERSRAVQHQMTSPTEPSNENARPQGGQTASERARL